MILKGWCWYTMFDPSAGGHQAPGTRQCTVLNDPYKHATSPILFCTINSVFSAIISGKLFLSVNITSESCLHEKSPVVFKILVLSRALLGAGPGRAVAPHHGDRDTHTHQPPPSMAIMLQNKHHAISIHFCPSFNHLSHIFSDLCLLYSWSSIIYSSALPGWALVIRLGWWLGLAVAPVTPIINIM